MDDRLLPQRHITLTAVLWLIRNNESQTPFLEKQNPFFLLDQTTEKINAPVSSIEQVQLETKKIPTEKSDVLDNRIDSHIDSHIDNNSGNKITRSNEITINEFYAYQSVLKNALSPNTFSSKFTDSPFLPIVQLLDSSGANIEQLTTRANQNDPVAQFQLAEI